MHILIIEPASSGHHFIYLEKIVTHHLKLGHQVTLCTPQCLHEHTLIKKMLSATLSSLNVIDLSDKDYQQKLKVKRSDIAREFYIRNVFKKTYQNANNQKPVDYVFLPYVDYCLYAIGLLGTPFGETQWSGICMRPSFHHQSYGVKTPHPKLSKLKQQLFLKFLSIKTLEKLFTIDEILVRFINDKHPLLNKSIEYTPDPAELIGTHTYQSARTKLCIPEKAVVILVYGAIDERKGIRALIKALNSSVADDVHLLLVGRQSEAVKAFLSTESSELLIQKRYHELNDFVTDEDQQMVFAASDIVWLGYRNHFTMSGVLVLAAVSEKPIISCSQGLIGWYTQEKKLGICIDIENHTDVCNSINDLRNEIKSEKIKISKKSFEKHNWEDFLNSIKPNEAS